MSSQQNTSWSLQDLLTDWASIQSSNETMITGLSIDSRMTQAGDLFLAMQGLHSHGLEFAAQAVANGAVAIAWECNESANQVNDLLSNLDKKISCIPVTNLQQHLSAIAQRFYQEPAEELNLIGVTGTDGKTSVSQFIAQSLSKLNQTCAVIGTLGYGIYPDLGPATHTTPDAVRVQSLLHDFVQQDVKHVVIEASSHGLSQGRLNDVAIDTAVFTNLGRDHMDYHGSPQAYSEAKRILFAMPKLKNAVINIDDEFGQRLASEFADQINLITYAVQNDQPRNYSELGSYIYAKNIRVEKSVTNIELDTSWGKATVQVHLLGKFNVSNVMAVMGVLFASGYEFDEVINIIPVLHTVAGRMQAIRVPDENADVPTVIIDYAHTPQALRNVLQSLQEHCAAKLWCVFGCGGDRDRGKRALMAQAVEQFASHAIITDDNPRTENPHAITEQIISGFSSEKQYTLIHDRKEAIEYAIQHAAAEDVVLIAGKGHEAVQIVNNEHLPFDDKEIASAYLRKYKQ